METTRLEKEGTLDNSRNFYNQDYQPTRTNPSFSSNLRLNTGEKGMAGWPPDGGSGCGETVKGAAGSKAGKGGREVCGPERAWSECGYRGGRPWDPRLSQGLRGAAGLPAIPAQIGLSVRGRGQSPVAKETAPPVPAARARTTARGSRRGGRGGRSAAGRLLGCGPAYPGDFGASRCPRP